MNDTPISATATPSAPAPAVTPTLAANIAELTARQATMTNHQYKDRMALITAFDAEVAAGGDGSVALGKSPDAIRGDEIAKALQPPPDVQPGVHAPDSYTRLSPELFGTIEERVAFGEAASAAGFDPQIVQGTLQSIRNDPAINRALEGGDAAIDAHLVGVRDFFKALPGGPERLNLAVSYLDHLADSNPLMSETVEVAKMSPDALSMVAFHAEQSGFKPPARR